MGLFFEKREQQSAKSIVLLRILIVITMGILLIMGLINGLSFTYFKFIFIVAGIGSLIDGIESLVQRGSKRVYLVEFGFVILWFTLAFLYWGN
ncbi:hypothetical protein J2S17_003584 [Cytobacillus purgationiresistens]|uniref:DUF4181 domain-containing protein n=2 Tax=Cytobacillus purgationiresistens TaxID=863449 RepID=A0ABU0AKA6_9BACI|nr:hypothetical protein [Cytobacillus purgationiresistens]